MNLRLNPILMMVLPKSSFYSLVTEKTCFFGWRNLTFFWFTSSTYIVLERKFEISLTWSPWVIFGPQIRYRPWVGPHLDDGPAKKFEILLAWSLWAISLLNISISYQYGVLYFDNNLKNVLLLPTAIEEKLKILLTWSLLVIFVPQIGYDSWFGPHLDYGSAKNNFFIPW